jgi:hypothetical protein
MTALAQDVVRLYDSVPVSCPSEIHTQLASTTIYKGAVAMQVAGKARPLVAATANSVLLGVSLFQQVAGASDRVVTDGAPFVFQRGVFAFDGKAGDLPTEALIDVAGGVYFGDDNTVQATTPGAPALGGTLRSIRQGFYWVEV